MELWKEYLSQIVVEEGAELYLYERGDIVMQLKEEPIQDSYKTKIAKVHIMLKVRTSQHFEM
jgi:hypothetical protein